MNTKDLLKNIPNSPGVYQFLDKDGQVLYIGKAKVLKNRLPQYFRGGGDGRPMIGQMVRQIASIKTIETDSEIEALILESELVRKMLPKYNVRLRDDKTYLMIKITKEDFPRVLLIRYNDYSPKDKSGHFFGPYTSGDALKKALKYLRKIFLFADCTENKFKSYQKKERPCLFGMIRRCSGPCAKADTKEAYTKEINYLKLFLKGEKKRLVQTLKREMITAARKKDFESATDLRIKIESLAHLNRASVILSDQVTGQSGINRIEAYDISNISGDYAVGGLVVAEGGFLSKAAYRKFKIKTVQGANDIAMTKEILRRRFKNDWPLPDLLVIDGGRAHFLAAKKIIEENKLRTYLLAIAKGPTRKKDELIYDDPALAKMLKKDDNLNKLIKSLRDEAHRFAISYYRLSHLKNLIPGDK